MKLTHRVWHRWVIIACFASLMMACSGLPDHLTLKFEQIPQQLKKHEEKLKSIKLTFTNRKKTDDWSFASQYAEKEQWENQFGYAQKKVEEAKTLYETKLKPLYERDEPHETQDFSRRLDEFDRLLAKSIKYAKHPSERMDFLIKAKQNAILYHSTAKDALAKIRALQNQLSVRAEQVTKDYAHKHEDVLKRLTKMSEYAQTAEGQYNKVKAQYDDHITTENADYALLGDSKVDILKSLSEIEKYESATQAKFDELYSSYTRVLADQIIDYYVVIRRAAWCEGEYCGQGSEMNYPAVKVDEKVFEYFDNYSGNLVAKMTGGWGSPTFRVHVQDRYWQALKLNNRYRMNSDYDYAEYWVHKTYTKSYHKYIDIVDEKQQKTDWIEVNENDFWKQWDNLGMAILTKPYGYYEEDTLTDAEPVGMALIAAPNMTNGKPSGANQYGEWRTDSNGNSFWYYYGMYAFLNNVMGGDRGYSYDKWKSYRNRKIGKPYYGEQEEYGTYGSSTYVGGSGYSRTEHARRYPGQIGKTRSRGKAPSIRSAGTSSRGRGAAGGGK